jgi:hypothetical protein
MSLILILTALYSDFTKMNFSGYFLIVSDFVKFAKNNDIPVGPGRGSGAGSLVAWVLEITELNPIKYGLIFERFLNPDRISMPDFDIDFCQDRREEIITYVANKYGYDKVAHIITFGKLQARAVLRDVGRVLQIPLSQVDKICKMVPFNPIDPITLEKAVEISEEVKAVSEWHRRMTHEGLNQKGQKYNLDHFTTGAKVYFYRPPSVLDVEKKTRKAKHIDHYVGPATIVKKIGSRSFQISFFNPTTGTTQLLQRDAGMIILKKEWIAPCERYRKREQDALET